MGWGVRSAAGVEIYELDCAHHEFLRQPQVGIVGQILADKIQSIRAATARRKHVLSATQTRNPKDIARTGTRK
jgi:hypothetical protein